jgi:hypothetical protein
MVAEPENGMPAIDKVLKNINAVDKLTGEQISADDVFADWVVATLLKDPKAGDGRYVYSNYPESPQPDVTETHSDCPTSILDRTVSQYGVDYIRLKAR